KLCAAIFISTPKERPIMTMALRIFQGETPLVEHQFDQNDLQAATEASLTTPESEDVQLRVNFITDLVISPFMVTEPTKLRVRLETEEGEMRGLALKIALASSPDIKQASPQGEKKVARPRKVRLRRDPAAKRSA
ncbi:MAG: hypothetical protein ABWY07_04795, partial [Burkholderiales bacterium]